VIPLTLTEIAAASGGWLDAVPDAERTVTGAVVADSRHAAPVGLFVAIPGERVDGHDYAAGALEAGAVAVLAERPVGVPAIIVPDSVVALGALASYLLTKIAPTVVGVTGSSGKTSTKDLLAHVLALRGPVVAPPGSYNTEVGVPLTVLSADETTRTLILEMGARGVGHIEYLCRIAVPDVSVVLNVGTAHVGEFGSREEIARAKSEIVRALPDSGTAVLNADDPLVRQMAALTGARVVMFGESVHADIRADQVALDDRGRASFDLVTPAGTEPVSMQLIGEHHVSNALATAASAWALGIDVAATAKALSDATARSPWRMAVTDRPDGVTVINDAYNANPESMRAALKALAALGKRRRTWAVLGEMRELGESAPAEHDALGRLVVRLDIDRLIAVGERARAIELGAADEGLSGSEASWVPDVDSALALLETELEPGDVVLVKASRAVGLESVAEALLARDDLGEQENVR
jgi:UDP-N-acetylmuramoyl-tripeptide--D-alanyl-D-alanine ligase